MQTEKEAKLQLDERRAGLATFVDDQYSSIRGRVQEAMVMPAPVSQAVPAVSQDVPLPVTPAPQDWPLPSMPAPQVGDVQSRTEKRALA